MLTHLTSYNSATCSKAEWWSLLFKLDQAALNLPAPPTESQVFDWSFLPNSEASK
ncbi:MAG TPA: hypothetical protein VIR57_00445 [Chloroflexota bacterium]